MAQRKVVLEKLGIAPSTPGLQGMHSAYPLHHGGVNTVIQASHAILLIRQSTLFTQVLE